MKIIILITCLLVLSATAFSQQTNSSKPVTKSDFLKKSKHQKTAAWIMLGSGTVVTFIGAGLIIVENDVGDGASVGSIILTCAGGSAMLGSLFLFEASSKNKRNALSLSFKNEFAPQIHPNGFVYRAVPSLNLKINL